MGRVILYVTYDEYEYINYYHLYFNNSALIQYCSEDRFDEVINKLYEIKSELVNHIILIVQDRNVPNCSFMDLFEKNGMALRTDRELCNDDIDRIFNEELKCEDSIGLIINSIDSIDILFYGDMIFGNEKYENNEKKITLEQAEVVLNYGGAEMTELARIIKEKYERITNHE